MTLLRVHNFNQSLGKKTILSSINFNADKGNIVVLLGPNGAGKTTLLKSIIGLHSSNIATAQTNTTNHIVFDNNIINRLPINKRVELGLLYLPQHTSLFSHMTVQDNLKVVYQYHAGWKNQPLSSFNDEVDHWLTATNLSHALKQKAGTLSGGQKRKLEVVRSLLMKPKMLMFDEPFAGVDPKSIYELKQIFTDLAHSGIGIVISDHHVDQLLSIAHSVYVIVGGQVVTSGSIQEILENPYTKESYLGKQFYQEMADRYL
jgi:lipopolysaccharide export system ATP-binding protein